MRLGWDVGDSLCQKLINWGWRRFSSPKGNGEVVTSNWGVGAGQAVRADVRLFRVWAGRDGSVICHISQWKHCEHLEWDSVLRCWWRISPILYPHPWQGGSNPALHHLPPQSPSHNATPPLIERTRLHLFPTGPSLTEIGRLLPGLASRKSGTY